ncbi:CD83 antigen-like [Periophthalmus magnuspinnatus]|uniref:CD83 antigen-like n=1 Tax=Periophthalmus magnuspinnatus TaxID=409849 RepID=UPI00145A1A5A|nr:CD83 antigen-like [Periophthalmus magnuspinnatus]
MILIWALLLPLACVSAVGDKLHEYEVSPGQNITLPCTANQKTGLQYWACRWYKETGVPRLSGLVSKTLPDGQMRWYVDADTRVSLEEGTLNLRLPTVTCSDQAVYQCYLAAPVGEQNRKGRVRLSVTGCPREEPAPRPPLNSPEPVVPVVSVDLLVPVSACLLLFVVLCSALFCLKKNQWNNPKKPIDHPLYPDLSPRPEKQKCIFVNFIFPPYSKICTSEFTHV